jgi:3-oxoadipate enol-lactonase
MLIRIMQRSSVLLCLIAGDQDNISPMSRSEELKSLLGGGEKVVLRVVHSGHQQILEDTDGVVKAMKSVLVL